MRGRAPLIVALAALLFVNAAPRSGRNAPAPPKVTLTPCTYSGVPAQCGVYTVPEIPVRRARTIDVHFVVVRAAQPAAGAAPVFPIAGGPGQSAIDTWNTAFQTDSLFTAMHAYHDVVIVDQRGTGASHALSCNLFANDTSTLEELYPSERLRACRDALADDANLDAYGSATAADDLDAIRRGLGYQSIILYGGSYGTKESFAYIRRHNAAVRAALMDGVAPPPFLIPLPFSRGAQHALDDLIAACSADAACNARFPSFAQEFASLLQGSEAGIPVDYVDTKTREHVYGHIFRAVFADTVRHALYSPESAAMLPLIIDRAAKHDTVPLAKLVSLLAHAFTGSLAMGMNLSVTCSEDVPFITDDAVVKQTADTFLADSRIRAQQEACRIWNVQPASPISAEPVHSNVPVLMISGADDPATPPQYGTQAVKYLPNGRQIVIPNGGHGNASSCVTQLEARFIETASTRGLDASGCTEQFKRPPFVLRLPVQLQK